MLVSPIFNVNHKELTFDFEEFIKNELGLKLDNQTKREGEFRYKIKKKRIDINLFVK